MENQLICLYLLVCQTYDTHSAACFQRASNNSQPRFTDQELVTIYLFGHLNGLYHKRAIHRFITNYWAEWFPHLPAYQTFSYRLNLLEPTFHAIGGAWLARLTEQVPPEFDHVIDSLPIMLAQGGHAYTARVARDWASVGYCQAKKTFFHGLRLHVIAARHRATLPRARYLWLREGACHDLPSVREQGVRLPATTLIGDKAFADPTLAAMLAQQNTRLVTPVKKPRGVELSAAEKYYNRLVSRLRQPIESFFNWLEEKTKIQRASKVRSTQGLLVHCFGKLTFAMLLLVFNY